MEDTNLIRLEALDRAVRVALSNGGNEPTEQIVTRAEAFAGFLTDQANESAEGVWRKAIADQVRRNCTPSSEAYAKGGDILIYAVADWIENPPDWSHAIVGSVDAGSVERTELPVL